MVALAAVMGLANKIVIAAWSCKALALTRLNGIPGEIYCTPGMKSIAPPGCNPLQGVIRRITKKIFFKKTYDPNNISLFFLEPVMNFRVK